MNCTTSNCDGRVVFLGLCGPCATAEGFEPSPRELRRQRQEAMADSYDPDELNEDE